MIKRFAERKLKELAKGFPAVAVVGPRQSGKTILVKKVFPNKPYILLEDPDTRSFANEDPRGFLAQFPDGAILDEVQRVPHLFSYLQGVLDEANIPGMFILSGSQNFLLMEKISQSLAGRIGIIKLLPFSFYELYDSRDNMPELNSVLKKGFYPRLYDLPINADDFYASYVQTYLERDLRYLQNVHDLSLFHRFLKMCALRVGQLLNLSSLAADCGISHTTAKSWISLLETSFIIYLLKPHYANFNKRLVKMPKLYFYDTGLLSYLADIQTSESLAYHSLRGGIFESFVIGELLKSRYNAGKEADLFFWRDKVGHEVDCVIEKGSNLVGVEIKSGSTIASDFFKGMDYLSSVSGDVLIDKFLVYAGKSEQKRTQARVLPFFKLNKILEV